MNSRTLLLLGTAGLFQMGCEAVINSLTFFPDTKHFIPEENLPDSVESIHFKTSDSIDLHGLFFKRENSRDLIIYFHGNAGNLYSRVDAGVELRNSGVNVLLVDYRGYGKSTGKPSEKGIYIDGRSSVEYARGRGFARENIVLLGRSLGTTVAVEIAQNQNYKGIILVSPLTSGYEYARAAGFSIFSKMAGESFNSLAKIGNVHSRVLVIHGNRDEVIPIKLGKKLYQAVPGSKKFVELQNAGHNNLQQIAGEVYYGSIGEFVGQEKN